MKAEEGLGRLGVPPSPLVMHPVRRSALFPLYGFPCFGFPGPGAAQGCLIPRGGIYSWGLMSDRNGWLRDLLRPRRDPVTEQGKKTPRPGIDQGPRGRVLPSPPPSGSEWLRGRLSTGTWPR